MALRSMPSGTAWRRNASLSNRVRYDLIASPMQPSSAFASVSSHWPRHRCRDRQRIPPTLALSCASTGCLSGNSSGSRRCSHGSTSRSSVSARLRILLPATTARERCSSRDKSERTCYDISLRQWLRAEDAREYRRNLRIEPHLQRTDMISQHDIGGCDDRIGLDRRGRASAAGAVRADDPVYQAELHRCHAQQCGDHVAGMAACSVMQVLVDQRQNTDQRVEAQCVARGLVGSVLAEHDPDIRIEPLARYAAAMQRAVDGKCVMALCVGEIDDIVGATFRCRVAISQQIAQGIEIAIFRPQGAAVCCSDNRDVGEATVVQQVDQLFDQSRARSPSVRRSRSRPVPA